MPVQNGRSRLSAKEHGFTRSLRSSQVLPESEIVPVALRIDSNREDWLALVDALAPLVDSKTLVVQSTDFSHYLDHGKARHRDQQTMNTLALGDPEAIKRLRQPAHLDSQAAQSVQMALQRRVHNATPAVIGYRNSQAYTPLRPEQTPKYIPRLRADDLPPPAARPEKHMVFRGDAFFGRGLLDARTKPSGSRPQEPASRKDIQWQ